MDFYNIIKEEILKNENIVLLGKGGEGKTTTLKKLLNCDDSPVKMNLKKYMIFHEYHNDIDKITGQFISAKMYQKVIILEREDGNYVIYDLTQQATNCDIDISDNLLFVFGPDDAKKMANGLRLSVASDPQMSIKSFSRNQSSFQKTVEGKCEQMKLNFAFGLDSEEGPIIGCQTTPSAKSAIMFRQDEKNKNQIIIAAQSFYEPLLNKFID